LENNLSGDFLLAAEVIPILDADAQAAGPDGRDRQKDQAPSVGFDERGMGADRAADAQSRAGAGRVKSTFAK